MRDPHPSLDLDPDLDPRVGSHWKDPNGTNTYIIDNRPSFYDGLIAATLNGEKVYIRLADLGRRLFEVTP